MPEDVSPSRHMDRRHLAGAFRLGLALAVILLLAMQIRDWWNPTTDAVSYFSIARSVWSGRGLTNLGDRRLHFAPGYPLLICPLFLLPHPFLWLSIARCVFALAALVAVYRWVREMLSEYAAVFVTAATACNISFWFYYRTPLSDLPMMLWMFWAALAARRALAARAAAGVTGWCAGAAVLVAAASATRQAALAVGVGATAVAVHEAVARRVSWRRALLTAAAMLLPAALGLAALAYYDGAMAGSDLNQTYVTKLQSALAAPLAQIAVGLHLRVADVGRLLIPGTWSSYARPGQWLDPNMLVDLPLVMLVAAGWWKLARRARDPLLWSMPLYVGLYVLWPYDQGTRFFMPILPVLLVSCWPWLRRIPRGRGAILVGICVAHLLVAGVRWVIETRRDGAEYRRDWPALAALAEVAAGERAPIADGGLSSNGHLWFEYLVDRRVAAVRPGESAPAEAGWLIQPESGVRPAKCVVVAQRGGYRLLRRKP